MGICLKESPTFNSLYENATTFRVDCEKTSCLWINDFKKGSWKPHPDLLN